MPDTGTETTTKRRLDAESLKALAHPLRVELFRALREGPATATQLAARLGESTGTVSWHLRHLARFRFIEDDPDRPRGRERWWRAASKGTLLDIRDDGIRDDPAAMEAARWFVQDSVRRDADRLEGWIAGAERWPTEWIGASVLSQTDLELTAAQLEALTAEIAATIERHRVAPGANPDPDARRVHLGVQAFPVGAP